jgi:hypothetical protein
VQLVTTPDLSPQIESIASGPADATVDGNRVVAQKLGDLIEADKYLSARAATRGRKRGLNLARFRPPGTVDRDFCP